MLTLDMRVDILIIGVVPDIGVAFLADANAAVATDCEFDRPVPGEESMAF